MSDNDCTPMDSTNFVKNVENTENTEELARILGDERYRWWLTTEEPEKADQGPENLPNRIRFAPAILDEAAATFRERGKVYGSTPDLTGRLLEVLYPNGLPAMDTEQWERWHIFLMIINKAARFVNSKHIHVDSIRDICVYAAMLESILTHHQRENPHE